MSNREYDMKAEKELNGFLDDYYYKNLINCLKESLGNEYEFDHERVDDTARQLQGIDKIIRYKKGNKVMGVFKIDEKAQLHYINKDLPTFAFEINSMQKGSLTNGWLYNKDLKTDFYLLIWPFATNDKYKEVKKDDFLVVYCLLIERNAIHDFLENRGLGKDNVHEMAKEIRDDNKYGKIKIKGEKDIWVYFTSPDTYPEAPINLVIRREKLKETAIAEFVVSKNNFIKHKFKRKP